MSSYYPSNCWILIILLSLVKSQAREPHRQATEEAENEFGYGIDVSSPVTVKQFMCLKQEQNKSFVIVRVWRSNGKPDGNAVATIRNARSADIARVDGYIFPCFEGTGEVCGKPREQIQQLLRGLKSVQVDKYWLDVESGSGWGANTTQNVAFLREMALELLDNGCSIGIYTSKRNWQQITNDSTLFGGVHLWYAHYDMSPEFDDFMPFGGWDTADWKQYAQNTKLCGVTVDLNSTPRSACDHCCTHCGSTNSTQNYQCDRHGNCCAPTSSIGPCSISLNPENSTKKWTFSSYISKMSSQDGKFGNPFMCLCCCKQCFDSVSQGHCGPVFGICCTD